MKAHGNSDRLVCAQNLLSISRGEVPLDRLRGRNPRLLERPRSFEIQADAKRVISWWEPRIDPYSSGFELRDGGNGEMVIYVKPRKEGLWKRGS